MPPSWPVPRIAEESSLVPCQGARGRRSDSPARRSEYSGSEPPVADLSPSGESSHRSAQLSSSYDSPDTEEAKEHDPLLCHNCPCLAEFLRDQEGETACTDILNCQISSTVAGGSGTATWTSCGTLIPRDVSSPAATGGSVKRLAGADQGQTDTEVLPAAPCVRLLTSQQQALEHQRGDAFSCSS